MSITHQISLLDLRLTSSLAHHSRNDSSSSEDEDFPRGVTPSTSHSFATVINIDASDLPGFQFPPGPSGSRRGDAGPSNSSASFTFTIPTSSNSHPPTSSSLNSSSNPFQSLGFPPSRLTSASGGSGDAHRGQASSANAMGLLGAMFSGQGGSGFDQSSPLDLTRAFASSSSRTNRSRQPPPQPSSVDPAGGASSRGGTRSSVQDEIRKAENTTSEADKQKRKQEDEEKLAEIYEGFEFGSLWDKLSDSLSRMQNDSNAAMILLPLIESLMVVSRNVATPEAASALESASSARGSVSPVTEHKPPARTPKEAMTQNFFAFTEKHRKILNTMVRANPSLMSGSFSLLVHNPKVLDFDNKRNYFAQQLHKGRRELGSTMNLSVRRQFVFADSFNWFSRHDGQQIKHGKLSVRFYNEDGIDAGGITREWFQVLARAMFNPDYALFAPCAADRTTYQPNRASAVNPDHLSFFKFVGKVIGKAIYDGRLLDAYFTRSFYKHILGKPVDYRDLEAVDPEYYKSIVWILQNDITDVLDFTFSVENEQFGETQTIDLKPNGRDIPVTDDNKMEYVKLVTEQRLTASIRQQIDAFLAGFNEIIPPHLIRIFSETELELLISGLPDIDVDEWRNNTDLHGYSASESVIIWFWRAVRSFDQETRAKLLQFITGTSKVPLAGFSHLQGVGGDQRTSIHRMFGSTDRLPAAHTCFNQLDLPAYASFDDLKRNLLLAINEGGEGFGFA